MTRNGSYGKLHGGKKKYAITKVPTYEVFQNVVSQISNSIFSS